MTGAPPRVAIVTGASRGIGAGLVTAYRELGYAVVATSREIARSDDPLIATTQGDIASPITAKRVIHEALERFGRIDTLVNNAGMSAHAGFAEVTDLGWYETLMRINHWGSVWCTHAALPGTSVFCGRAWTSLSSALPA